jgi:hypothetical protein
VLGGYQLLNNIPAGAGMVILKKLHTGLVWLLDFKNKLSYEPGPGILVQS